MKKKHFFTIFALIYLTLGILISVWEFWVESIVSHLLHGEEGEVEEFAEQMEFVEDLGGRLEFESEPGKGSIFYLTLLKREDENSGLTASDNTAIMEQERHISPS